MVEQKERKSEDLVSSINSAVENTIPDYLSEEKKSVARYFVMLGILSLTAMSAQAHAKGSDDIFAQSFKKEFISFRLDSQLSSIIEVKAFKKILESKGKIELIDEIILRLTRDARIKAEPHLKKSFINDNAKYFIHGLLTCSENLSEWTEILSKNEKGGE